MTSTAAPGAGHVSYREALSVWVRVALQSFGGPAGQIAVMHRILVDEKRWVGEARFLHALNYCMLLPGPEAQQLATYIGWLFHGWRGGLTAGLLFVLPGFLSILALSFLYALYSDVTTVSALFFGLKAAVLAVVVEAVLRIGKRVLKNGAMYLIAAAAFVALFVFTVPFPFVVIGAALVGLLGGTWAPDRFAVLSGPAAAGGSAVDAVIDAGADRLRPSVGRAVRTAAFWLTVWLAPVVALSLLAGEHALTRIAQFFSTAAVVTFGGAYAVLAYVAQAAVEQYGWLQPGEMLDGLGMAETTPGPLIQVVQFVGFMGAWREPGALSPAVAALAGAVVTTWVTFAPSFLWIFTGAPWVEALRGRARLTAALSAITAAVVGVILNLALWFALHTLFGRVDEVHAGPLRLLVPELSTLDPFALLLSAGAMLAMLRFHVGMLPTLAACALLGVAWRTLQ